MASAQLPEKQYDRAEALAKLKARQWPAHFADAPQRIAELER